MKKESSDVSYLSFQRKNGTSAGRKPGPESKFSLGIPGFPPDRNDEEGCWEAGLPEEQRAPDPLLISPFDASQGGENCERLLCGVFVACDLELDRRRRVLGGHQCLDDADGVNGFGDRFDPGA